MAASRGPNGHSNTSVMFKYKEQAGRARETSVKYTGPLKVGERVYYGLKYRMS